MISGKKRKQSASGHWALYTGKEMVPSSENVKQPLNLEAQSLKPWWVPSGGGPRGRST